MIWKSSDLERLVEDLFGGHHFVVVSNREPFEHVRTGSAISVRRPPGGVVTGLDPVMKAAGGTWLATASGNADREVVDEKGKVRVPPGAEAYTLMRLWLSKAETDGYYFGFANEALWPLCHIAYRRPTFVKEDWAQYVAVNRKMAGIVLEEIGDSPAVLFVQDYHLALLPRFVKEVRPDVRVAHFWHIPWPNYEAFRICPHKEEIIDGLLGSDLLGFHIRHHCNNFLHTVDNTVETRTDRERTSIYYNGHETLIRNFPISVDFEALGDSAVEDDAAEQVRLREEFGLREKIVLSVDRIDYTKGIPERLLAIDLLLDEHPGWKGRTSFLQVGAPSRTHIQAYRQLKDEIDALVERVNWKQGDDSWVPVVQTGRRLRYAEILTLYRMADVVVVSSLHDGMNLVAKEFVSCRRDGDGVLVLSCFTGAARELSEALRVNPYDREDLASAMARALDMEKRERRRRMKKLREKVEANNIYRWAGKILLELSKV